MGAMEMKLKKKERQQQLQQLLRQTPFLTDEALAEKFHVSIQTIRLDRLECGIPELRERMKTVATKNFEEHVKSIPTEEVIGDIIDIELDRKAISILDVTDMHVFQRNKIARGHHLFAQANSLAVAVVDDELALTVRSTIHFLRPVKQGERVVARATVKEMNERSKRTVVEVVSTVDEERVFKGTFEMYRMSDEKGSIES